MEIENEDKETEKVKAVVGFRDLSWPLKFIAVLGWIQAVLFTFYFLMGVLIALTEGGI